MDSRLPRGIFYSIALMAFYFAGPAAHGSTSSGEPPRKARGASGEQSSTPKVTTELTPVEDLDWSPLFSSKEHLPMLALREVFDGIKRGGAENFEKAVRAAYGLVEAYGRNEGHEITFQLSDFKTMYTPDALRLKFSEINSIDVRDRITISSTTRVDIMENGPEISKKTNMGYALKWEAAPPDPDQDRWAKRSISDYIEIARPDLPALSLLRALTSYKVSVTFEGVHRDYRAAFLWMGASAGSPISTFQSLEPVANRVGLVLAEQIPPEGKQEGSPRIKPEVNNFIPPASPEVLAHLQRLHAISLYAYLGQVQQRLACKQPILAPCLILRRHQLQLRQRMPISMPSFDRSGRNTLRSVEAIGLDYKESRARDRYGNEFRYRGDVWLTDGRKSRSVDVFLLHD